MSCLGNLLWFLCCGLWQGLSWLLAGLLWCVTIVGIPIGLQCFKFASLAFFPFGKEVRYGGGTVSLLLVPLGMQNQFGFWSVGFRWQLLRQQMELYCAVPSLAFHLDYSVLKWQNLL